MCPASKNLSNVKAEFPDVRAALTPNPEENVLAVHLKKVQIVDSSLAELPLDRGAYRGSLINLSVELVEDCFQHSLLRDLVESHDTHVFFAT